MTVLAVLKTLILSILPVGGLFLSLAGVPPTASPPAAQTAPVASATSAEENVTVRTAEPEARAPRATVETPRGGISLSMLKDCLAGSVSGQCLDALFREFLKTHSAMEALALIQRYEAEDTGLRLACHPVVHAVGRETFRLRGTIQDSFQACDQTCHSGCYHGAMERFIRGAGVSEVEEAAHISLEELRAKAAGACDLNQPTRFRFQCLHGLGHALLFFSDYRLRDALSGCDAISDAWGRSSCYGGLFMENVFAASPEKRDLSSTDYHYPCSALESRYQSDCYMMQTTRMSEMGLATEGLFAECRRAGAHSLICIQSIGRDLSNDVRVGDPRLVSQKCELGSGSEREACTRGVAYALADNTWDGRYAFPFCASFADRRDASHCFSISREYLQRMFEKTPGEMGRECALYAPQSSLCREAVGG